jgi:hypothetical protein
MRGLSAEAIKRLLPKVVIAMPAVQAMVWLSSCFGLKWLCAALIIKLPWSNRYWALPFMTVLCPLKKHDEQKGIKHKSSVERGKQLVYIISRLLNRSCTLLSDGVFPPVLGLGNSCIKSEATLISRLRLDAALYDELTEEPAIKQRGHKHINLSPETIVEYFVLRWNLKVTFEEARPHLGIETHHQWSPKAIKRTTPVLFSLFSLICLIDYRQNQQENDLARGASTAWYSK